LGSHQWVNEATVTGQSYGFLLQWGTIHSGEDAGDGLDGESGDEASVADRKAAVTGEEAEQVTGSSSRRLEKSSGLTFV
jgi:hypothetical protein